MLKGRKWMATLAAVSLYCKLPSFLYSCKEKDHIVWKLLRNVFNCQKASFSQFLIYLYFIKVTSKSKKHDYISWTTEGSEIPTRISYKHN